MENSELPDLTEVERSPAATIDYASVPIRDRLKSKVWEARFSAFEEMLARTDKSLIFDSIACEPNAFLDELTIRGQESALKCITSWVHGLVELSGASVALILGGVLSKYSISSQPRIKDLVAEVFRVVAERFGVMKAASFLIRSLASCAHSLIPDKNAAIPTRHIAKGTLFRQISGCLCVLADLKKVYRDECSFEGALSTCKNLSQMSAIDKQTKEAIVSFLNLFGEADPQSVPVTEETQENKPPTNRVVRGGLGIGLGRHSSLSNSIDSLHGSRSTTAGSPECAGSSNTLRSLLSKEWMETVESGPRWQDRRDSWSSLNAILSKTENSPVTLPEEVLQIMMRTVKNESNVPISVEVLTCASKVVSKQVLGCMIPRLRDKNAPVQKSVFACIVSMLKNRKSLIDQKLIEFELKPVCNIARKEVISLIDQLLPLPGLEAPLLRHLMGPALADSDIPVRDMAIQVCKKILADASTRDDCVLTESVNAIKSVLEELSVARRKVIEEALGMKLTSPCRPQSATSSARRLPLLPQRRPVTAPAQRNVVRSQLRTHLPENLVREMFSPNLATVLSVLSSWSQQTAIPLELMSKWIIQIIEKWREKYQIWVACMDYIEKNFPSEKFIFAILPSFLDYLSCAERSVVPLIHSLISKHMRPESALRLIIGSIGKKTVSKIYPKRESAVIELLIMFVESKPKLKKELVRLVLLTDLNERIRSAIQAVSERDHEVRKFFLLTLKSDLRDSAKLSLHNALVKGTKSPHAPNAFSHCLSQFRDGIKDENLEKVQESCSSILTEIESAECCQAIATSIVETLSSSLQSVLASSNSGIRQAVLTLLHNVTRIPSVWISLSGKTTLKNFLLELLHCVNDKKLRSFEPEIWADLNLSVVHAIANSHRPTAYQVLLDLSEDSALSGLATKCIEKLNRSLPQFLAEDEVKNLRAVLSALREYIRENLDSSENILLNNECIKSCLKSICSVAGLVEVGEFVGLHLGSDLERSIWKQLLKSTE